MNQSHSYSLARSALLIVCIVLPSVPATVAVTRRFDFTFYHKASRLLVGITHQHHYYNNKQRALQQQQEHTRRILQYTCIRTSASFATRIIHLSTSTYQSDHNNQTTYHLKHVPTNHHYTHKHFLSVLASCLHI